MSSKKVYIPGIGPVALYKRKDNRSIRLSISLHGHVRMTMPRWTPYQAAIEFARLKSDWIIAEKSKRQTNFYQGQTIGKHHYLRFQFAFNTKKIASKLTIDEAIVSLPSGINIDDNDAQVAARAICTKALRREAEEVLPKRLTNLAQEYKFEFTNVSVRKLTSRWGSCNEKGEITLNLFLMQLPWDLIDYVLLHELTHTKIMHHGPKFWTELERHTKNAKQLRKQIRSYNPDLFA